MTRTILAAVLLTLMFMGNASGQQSDPAKELAELNSDLARVANSNSLSGADRKVLVDAFKAAVNQNLSLTPPAVRDNVSVHAVLLPYDVCSRVFGKETAEHYAAIQLIVANRSDQANLIVHSLFADLSHWPLAGKGFAEQNTLPQPATWESAEAPGAIGSVEYRGVRGELLTHQPYTIRNRVISALTLAGTIAAAYQFSLKEKGFLRGISAFNGQVIPGFQEFWPDDTVAQLNRISDVGFQVNKVVAQQSAEIIVAFYPLKRFLPGGFREIFKREPSLFFAPMTIAVDTRAAAVVQKYAPDLFKLVNLDNVRKAIVVYPSYKRWQALNLPASSTLQENEARKEAKRATYSAEIQNGMDGLELLNSISLNTVRIGIGGTMVVDMDSLPPSVQEIAMDNPTAAETWLEPGAHSGTLHGKFLLKSSIQAACDKDPDIKAEVLTDGASDNAVKFTLTTTKRIPSGSSISFRVSKEITTGGKKTTAYSAPYLVPAIYAVKDPTIGTVSAVDTTVTVPGTGFLETSDTGSNFKVRLVPSQGVPGAVPVEVPAAAVVRKPTNLTLDLTKLTAPLVTACWAVEVSVIQWSPPSTTMFPIPATPTLGIPTQQDKSVVIKGNGFFDPAGCKRGSVLTFKLAKDDGTEQAVTHQKLDSALQASIDAPAAGTWTVRLYIDAKKITESKAFVLPAK